MTIVTSPEFQPWTHATAHEVWELKGHSIAVFGCQADLPFANLQALPSTAVFTPATPTPLLADGIRRVILKDYPERFFFQRDELQALINGVVLPAFRRRVPLYFFTECSRDFFTECSRDFFSAGELPFGDQTALTESLRLLAREQLAALLAQMCILFPSPDAITEADGPPMTPIERQLSKAMTQLGLAFTAQVPLGPYLADFTLAAPDGRVLVVEADGRDYHDAARDAVRDAALVAHHGVAVGVLYDLQIARLQEEFPKRVPVLRQLEADGPPHGGEFHCVPVGPGRSRFGPRDAGQHDGRTLGEEQFLGLGEVGKLTHLVKCLGGADGVSVDGQGESRRHVA